MKFVLLVEGATESRALPSFLSRWTKDKIGRNIGFKPVECGGCSRLMADAPKYARKYARDPEVIGVFGLLDLKGPDYPSHVTSVSERVRWLKETMTRQVADPKFRLFVAVHDLEAWVLAEPSAFPSEVRPAVEALSPAPENVDLDNPPKVRLRQLYRQHLKREFKETVDSVKLFERADPAACAARCPHLNELLSAIREMTAGIAAAG